MQPGVVILESAGIAPTPPGEPVPSVPPVEKSTGPPSAMGASGAIPALSKITFYIDVSRENFCLPGESSENDVLVHISAYLPFWSKLKHARRPRRGFPQKAKFLG